MRRKLPLVGKLVVCTIALTAAFGCGTKTVPTPQAVSTADQLQKIQSNPNLSDQQKAQLTTVVKSVPPPPPPH